MVGKPGLMGDGMGVPDDPGEPADAPPDPRPEVLPASPATPSPIGGSMGPGAGTGTLPLEPDSSVNTSIP